MVDENLMQGWNDIAESLRQADKCLTQGFQRIVYQNIIE